MKKKNTMNTINEELKLEESDNDDDDKYNYPSKCQNYMDLIVDLCFSYALLNP